MKFIVEIPDDQIRDFFGTASGDFVELRAKEEVEVALNSGTAFLRVKVTVATDGGAV